MNTSIVKFFFSTIADQQPLTLPNEDSTVDVFPWILENISKSLFYRAPLNNFSFLKF